MQPLAIMGSLLFLPTHSKKSDMSFMNMTVIMFNQSPFKCDLKGLPFFKHFLWAMDRLNKSR